MVVVLGLAAGLDVKPAEAGSKDALIGFGVGVGTGIIINEAVRNSRTPPPGAAPPPQRRSPPPRRRDTRNNRYDRAEAMKIQAALNDLGYDAGVVDGIIGRGTRKAIRTFQVEIDEDPTGVLTNKQKIILYDRAKVANTGGNQDNQNLATNRQPQNQDRDTNNQNQDRDPNNQNQDRERVDNQTDDDDRVVDNDQSSYDWTKVQQALNALGYPAGPENGRLTKLTRDAIKAFQTDISHEATGVLTAEEQSILFEDAADLARSDDESDDGDDNDEVVLLGSDPSSETSNNDGGGVTNNLVLTEYRAVSSITDPLQQLKAVRDARQNPPAFVADLSAADRLARESQLSQLEADVKQELLSPIVEQADAAPVSLAGIRQIATLEGSAEAIFSLIGPEESKSYRDRLQSRQQRIMKALVSDQVGELKSYPQTLDGLQQSADWYDRFMEDFAGFNEDPLVVDAIDTFETDRSERLKAMVPTFERDVAELDDPSEDAEDLLDDYLSWEGDEALPISLEYQFVVAQQE